MCHYYFCFCFWCYVEHPQPRFPLKSSKDSRRGLIRRGLIRHLNTRGIWIACFCSLLSGSPRGNYPFMTSFPVYASICYFVISSKAQFSSRWSEGPGACFCADSALEPGLELAAPRLRMQRGGFFPAGVCLQQVMCLWLLEQRQT